MCDTSASLSIRSNTNGLPVIDINLCIFLMKYIHRLKAMLINILINMLSVGYHYCIGLLDIHLD